MIFKMKWKCKILAPLINLIIKHRRVQFSKYFWPDTNLYGEPGIADVLNVEESVVRVGAVLVQAPDGRVLPGDRHVPDDGDPHVRVGLQAEGEDGGADEENWDHSDHLRENEKLFVASWKE